MNLKYFRDLLTVLLFLNVSFIACSDNVPHRFEGLDQKTEQVVYLEGVGKSTGPYVISLWERSDKGWSDVVRGIPVEVGRNGIALTSDKKEGDGKTPSGIYPLGPAFGYTSHSTTKLEYRQATENDFWVDDPQSNLYNQWVHGQPEARSYEKLKRDDDLYKYAVVVRYNAEPVVAGNGSAIFMHVWRGLGQPTAGCIAMSEENMKDLLNFLDKDKHPVIIIDPPDKG